MLEHSEAEAVTVAGRNRVSTDLVYGEPSAVLIGRSEDAQMVVTGSRGHGGFPGLGLGSVSLHVASRSRCPAVVVRGNETNSGPIVVGVDGSEPSESALVQALETARSLGARVLAATCWDDPFLRGRQASRAGCEDALEAEARFTLDAAVSPWIEKFSDVTVEESVVRGGAAHVLDELTAARAWSSSARTGPARSVGSSWARSVMRSCITPTAQS